MIPLSILDLSVVTTGTKPAAALRNSIDSGRATPMRWAMSRYWLAEHHNLSSVASPAARSHDRADRRCQRAASGSAPAAVMLPNHAPLVVAERLQDAGGAVFPAGSISGSARAPGTDGATAPRAAQAGSNRREGDDFLERLHGIDIVGDPAIFSARPSLPQCGGDAGRTRRCRRSGCSASSDYSSEALRPRSGMGFAFRASFCPPMMRSTRLTNYHRRFKPSGLAFPTPHGILAVAVVAAETDAGGRTAGGRRWISTGFAPRPRPVICRCRASEEALGPIPYTDGGGRASIARNRTRLFRRQSGPTVK